MPKTCIIIPCYNEEKRLNVKAFCDFLENNKDIDFCFVNDGSEDNTSKVLQDIKLKFSKQVILLELDKNAGKASAIREGVLYVLKNSYKFIGYWDADLSTPLFEITNMKSILEDNNELLIVLGSRIKRLGATIERKVLRHYLGRMFSTFSSLILKLPVYDSQCGAKLFRIEVVDYLFGRPFLTNWLFDVELLARLRNHIGVQKVLQSCYEYPLSVWKDIGGSKLSFFHIIKVPYLLIKIHINYNFSKK